MCNKSFKKIKTIECKTSEVLHFLNIRPPRSIVDGLIIIGVGYICSLGDSSTASVGSDPE